MEFLFENPFILIVLIGIISSLFKKKKVEEKSKSPNPKPFVESMPFPEPDIVQEFEYTHIPEQEVASELDAEKKQLEEEIASLKKQKQSLTKETERLKSIDRTQQVSFTPKETSTPSTQEQTLVEAVIWSEILGPPRSRKPHHSCEQKLKLKLKS